MKYHILISISLLLIMLNTSCNEQTMDNQYNAIVQEIFPADAPGAALLIIENGIPVFAGGYGLANMETKDSVTRDTHFRMASVSKQFTAMCMLILQEQGKLKVTDHAKLYLPSLPEAAKEITIQQLMSHTSGIPDYESLIPRGQQDQVSDEDVLRLVGETDSLYFEPGTKFKYSNTAFCLMTLIAEKVSGMPYPEFIRQFIFEPFGMEHTVIYEKDKDIFQRAFGYHLKDNEWKFADQSITSATKGDGSVYTSINEYRNWLLHLWQQDFNHLWRQEFGENETNPFATHAQIKKGLDYGYGWFISEEDDGSTGYFHSGESTGFHNIVYHNPSKKNAVVLFTNCDDDRVAIAFDKVMNARGIHLKEVPEGESLFGFLSKIYGE